MPSEDVQRFRPCEDLCTFARSGGRHLATGNETCSLMRTDNALEPRGMAAFGSELSSVRAYVALTVNESVIGAAQQSAVR
jgi:hypothetical protein